MTTTVDLPSLAHNADVVDILLAAYNGQAYLQAQLDSLLAQTYPHWRLLARDDGSNDDTPALLRAFQESNPDRVCLLADDLGRLGAGGSFGLLLRHSQANYTLFCDQDDIWLPEKIAQTLHAMQEMEHAYDSRFPLLVHTDLKLVDQDLNPIAASLWEYENLDPRRGDTLARLLIQNVVTGCTALINRPLRELALPIPSEALLHDWWLGLAAAAFGKIGYLSTPQVLYRQHRSNKVGARRWGIDYVYTKFLRPEAARRSLADTRSQAAAFAGRYQDRLAPEAYALVHAYANLDRMGPLERRWFLIRNGLLKTGFARNLGLLLWT